MDDKPSTNGSGRRPDGTFAKGNAYGTGNPLSAQVQAIRSELFKIATPKRVRRIFNKLLDLAESGDMGAIREVLSRLLGEAQALDLLARVEQLEQGNPNQGTANE